MDEKEFIETSANRHTYRIIESLPGRLGYMGKGHKIDSSTLYDNGYNILGLVKDGYIKNIDEPYEWQKELVGKNEHSVYSYCPQCASFGINMPLNNICGNCGYQKCMTYYDAQTIDSYLTNLKH